MASGDEESGVPTPPINILEPPTRPPLQSKATTAVSLTDVHTALPHDTSEDQVIPRSRAASIVKGFSSLGYQSPRLHLSREADDNASIRSFRSFVRSPATELDDIFEDLRSLKRNDSPPRTPQIFREDVEFFVSKNSTDALLNEMLDCEFDELEALEADSSNEESLMERWTNKLKHYLILSSAGKPVYSRHGDDQLISNSIGVVQTIISMIQTTGDTLKSFSANNTRFVVQTKGHLHLIAISRIQESETELRSQLEALYMQILSTLTLPSMERMFLNRPSTDLRRPLEGTENLLSSLADNFTRGSPSTLLSALECLRLRKSQREIINQTMIKCRSSDLLYGLVVANGQLVSVIRPKKHSLHPGDLHLIFNMLFNSEGLRGAGGENWFPICLPGFNNTGYLYMYVSFINQLELEDCLKNDATETSREEDDDQPKLPDVVIVLTSTNKESFYQLRDMRKALYEDFRVNGSLRNIVSAVKRGRPSCTDIVPGTVLRHFLYKSRVHVQFVRPSSNPHFVSLLNWRKLMSLYSSLHNTIHAKNASLKICHCVVDDHVLLGWITTSSEIYCIAGPTTSRTALAQAATKLEQWAHREEERLFIVGGAVF